MASTSMSASIVGDDDEEEEFEHFDDFTVASSWERFISEIEAVCRQWMDDGPKNLLVKDAVQMDPSMGLYMIQSEFEYTMKSYCMEYYFETNNDDKVSDWNKALHDLQLAFGVKEFLVITPQSASGVVLDAPEASKLLSAVAIALSNCSCLWPAFVPVHDPSREAYIGIQNMGTVFTRRFEADRIGSQVPVKLMHLEGLYELFVSKFAYAAVDLSLHHSKIRFNMKLTYRTPTYDYEDEVREANADIKQSSEDIDTDANVKLQWDDDCPWSDWYTAEDPVKGFQLLALWCDITAESSLDMTKLENASPLEAQKWLLYPILSPNVVTSDGNSVGFASQLRLLVEALEMSLEAQFMEDFVTVQKSGSENLKPSAVIPPPTVLDLVLKDLFHEVKEAQVDFSACQRKSSQAIKGAPLDSLFAQFCLHALWFGNCNIRAIAVLWIEFVREVRWCWEELQPLPRMPLNGTIDLSTCLISQKLHMLAICIQKKPFLGNGHGIDSNVNSTTAHLQENLQIPQELSRSRGVGEDVCRNTDREGSAKVTGSMMLLKSCKIMHTPITQDPPPMTEDMHDERLQAAEALGFQFSSSAQLEKNILASDMSAFKAANPDAVFEDFIRWHSPKDWESDVSKGSKELTHSMESSEVKWPPNGRLSERMSDRANSWRKIWNEAPPLPACEQKPLLDPNREGEKVLHYLETLRPHQLLQQIVCTAFRAAADTLNQTSFGGLKEMTTEMGQLYITMASVLNYIQSYNTSVDFDFIKEARSFCVNFEHIEKLLQLAASLHRRLSQGPHLAEAIFSDYYDRYFSKTGMGSAKGDSQEYAIRLEIQSSDRNVIAEMFTPPTANQTWRKVSSMGNLLNGHEPNLREMIFSKCDKVSGNYYASCTPMFYEQEIETYRMYVSETSNDLRVALAVSSCD